MGFFDRFRKKKVETEEKTVEQKERIEEMTDLEEICMGDREVYEALSRIMFLDPRKIEVSIKDSEKKAKEFENRGDKVRARTWYETAGRLAIYEGDVNSVKEYFSKCTELSSESDYPILKIPEKAVNKAQEYYRKHLKE